MTGAHLAYAFIIANHNYKLQPFSKTGKIKCVMYCGPSNKSVDVVLGMYCSHDCDFPDVIIHHCLHADMFLNHPNIKDLRILRIYSKSIETKRYTGPYGSKV